MSKMHKLFCHCFFSRIQFINPISFSLLSKKCHQMMLSIHKDKRLKNLLSENIQRITIVRVVLIIIHLVIILQKIVEGDFYGEKAGDPICI